MSLSLTFLDEILASYKSETAPVFKLVAVDALADEYKLQLMNTISQASLPVNAGNMNQLVTAINSAKTNSGTFTEDGTLASPYEKNIALGSSDFKVAIVMFRDAGYSGYGIGGIVTAGTTQGSAISFYGHHTSGSLSTFGLERGSDSALASSGTNPFALTGSASVQLIDCYINGSNLHFKWSGAPANGLVVHWRVIK